MCSFVLLLLKIKSNLVQGFDRGKPAAFNVTVAAVLSSILCKEAQCAFSILRRALHAWHVLCIYGSVSEKMSLRYIYIKVIKIIHV